MKANPSIDCLASAVTNRIDHLASSIRSTRFLGLLLVAAFAGQSAEAQIRPSGPSLKELTELSLEELVDIQVDLVFGASRFSQKVTEAPASVSIVTADEIKKFGHRTLADALRSVRGLYVSNDRTYSYLGSQGFQRPGDFNTRYLFLIDGHRMNDNIFNAIGLGTESVLDIEFVDRVEVIRGPSSSIYGSNAFLGVINIVTKTGRQIDGMEGSFEAGSFDTYKGRFSFGKKFTNGVEWLLSGSYYTSEGQERLYFPEFDERISSDPRARNQGIAQNSDSEEYRNFFSSLSYRGFTVTGLYSFRLKDVPTAPYGAFFGSEPSWSQDERKYLEVKYDHSFEDGSEFTTRVAYDAFPHIGRFPYDYSGSNQPAGLVYDYDGVFGDWLTAEAQLKRQFLDRHTVIVGAEIREDLTQHLFNYDTENTVFIDDHRSGRSFGAFGQVEAVLRPDLLLNAGLRFDHFDTFGETLNPRVGLIYNPWEKTSFKLLYGQAFRAPNDYELYYGSPSYGQVPNPELEPETIQTYELVYEQYLLANLRFSASGYYYEIDDLISQTLQPGTGFLIFENLERVRARGVEFELEGKYAGGLFARASYTLQRTENADTGQALTNSPRHLIKANLTVPLYAEKVFASFELQYQSGITVLSGRRTDSYVIGNATLYSKAIARNMEVSASVYNVFDTRYDSPGSGGHLQDTIPQDGRSFRLKLTYKY
jgi:iron complex outermembrane receptor protein